MSQRLTHRGQQLYKTLLNASQEGHLEIVKYFIEERHTDPSCRNKDGVTALHLAATNGQFQVVKYLTQEKQCDPNSQDKISNIPLHYAALCGHLEVVHFFISKLCCDPMCRGHWDRTPLHDASQEGHTDVVRYLIEEGQVDPSCQDVKGLTPLHLAAKNGQLQVVKYLILEKQCDPNSKNKLGSTPFHYAALRGQVGVVQFFISQLHCDPMCRDQLDRTPLDYASMEGHIDVVKYLIEKGQADPSCQDENGGTPLHLSSRNGQFQVVKYLTQEKLCDPTSQDRDNDTPLHVAAVGGQLEVVQFLISQLHCDPMCRDQLYGTPLHDASHEGHVDVVKYLVEDGQADPSCQDENGDTPLHLAAENGQLQVVKYFTQEKHCDPHSQNKINYTPFHYAALGGHLEVVQFFTCQLRCDIMCRGQQDRTPLHCASQKGHVDVVKYLIEEGQANPSCQDENGDTPLHLALRSRSILTVKYLEGVSVEQPKESLASSSSSQSGLSYSPNTQSQGEQENVIDRSEGYSTNEDRVAKQASNPGSELLQQSQSHLESLCSMETLTFRQQGLQTHEEKESGLGTLNTVEGYYSPLPTPPSLNQETKTVGMQSQPKGSDLSCFGANSRELSQPQYSQRGNQNKSVTVLRGPLETLSQQKARMKEQVKLLPLFPSTIPSTLPTLPGSHTEFIDPVEIIHCDRSGGIYYNPRHGITLRIPEEAILHGELEISIGVRLHGNFNFINGLSPVSAIVWLCCQTETVFLKPIEVIIPHFMECRSIEEAKSLEMQFMKASHKNPFSEATQFLQADGEADFTSLPNKGILYTQHFCYLCIAAGISPDQIKSRRFCIACAVPRPLRSGSIVYFYVLYFLDTCIQSVEAQFASVEERYSLQKPRIFSFSDMLHCGAAITGEYQCSADNVPVTLTLQPTRISQDLVDFWQLHQNGELTLMEKMKMYPPSMELTFGDLTLCEEQIITVLFRGTQELMKFEIIVPSTKGTSINTPTCPVECKAIPMPGLQDMPTMRQLYQLKTVPSHQFASLRR